MQEQPDIEEHGRLFSYAFIYLLNIVGVAAWIVAVTPATLTELGALLLREAQAAYLAVLHGAQFAREKFQRL